MLATPLLLLAFPLMTIAINLLMTIAMTLLLAFPPLRRRELQENALLHLGLPPLALLQRQPPLASCRCMRLAGCLQRLEMRSARDGQATEDEAVPWRGAAHDGVEDVRATGDAVHAEHRAARQRDARAAVPATFAARQRLAEDRLLC